MLAFLRDYIIYLWNVLFKQTRPASAALTSTEGNKDSAATGSTSSASTTFPIASADTKDKVEEPRPEPPSNASTPTRDRVEEPKPVAPEPPASTKSRVEQPKPEPPPTKIPVPTSAAEVGAVDSISPPPPKPASAKPSVKPADLSYPSAPQAQQEKRIPPEPSRPPPSLFEPKIVCNAVPPPTATKQVPPPFEVKVAPTLAESESVSLSPSPPPPPKPSPQESRPAPAKLAPAPPQSPVVKSIPNKESEKVGTKPVQPVAESPRVEDVLLKPKIVQEVKREVPARIESKDFDDEDEYEYEEEEVEVEEEDIDDYIDHLATGNKPHLPPAHPPQQARAPLKVEEYDSEDDLIADIDRLDDRIIESK